MAEGYVNLGRAYMLNGQPELAAKCFQHALYLDPRLVGVHVQLGEAFEYSGARQQAIEQYERALAINPTDARAAEALSRIR